MFCNKYKLSELKRSQIQSLEFYSSRKTLTTILPISNVPMKKVRYFSASDTINIMKVSLKVQL